MWLPPRSRAWAAREAIAEGEVVVRLGGEVLTDEEFRARTLNLVKYSALKIDDGLNLLIDDDSPTTFGNHSCDANLWMVDAVTLIARRPIAAGEEVSVDYATHTADPPVVDGLQLWLAALPAGGDP